jgi:uncharacterized protein YqjF (DUF2071 family)
MGQSWIDLLFAHWRVPYDVLREHVPRELALDRFDGDAWLGITPFELVGLRPSVTPPIPGVGSFPELNVRTYATLAAKPGIFFFSLDAGSDLAVAAARRFYSLPYFRAHMTIERENGRITFESARVRSTAHLWARYASGKPLPRSQPGPLEHFLTERYCLYTAERGRVYRAEIHHRPWPLQNAEAEIDLNTMPPDEIRLEGDPVVHFSARQDVIVWPLRPV